jgi:hypothetical protein
MGGGPNLNVFRLIDRYVESFPEADRALARRDILLWFEPHPLRRPDAAHELFLAEQWEKAGEPEKMKSILKSIEERLASEPEDQWAKVAADRQSLVRWFAKRGDLDGFRRQIEPLVALRKDHPKDLYWNPTGLLPPPKEAKEPAAFAEALRPLIGVLDQNQAATQKLEVAAWLGRAKDAQAALPFLTEASLAIGERAHARLLEADIRRAAGDVDGAYAVERSLLDADALNLRRLPRLLDEIAAREGEAAARAAAARVAQWSDHPAALRRAAHFALDSSDRPKASELIDRLAAVSPRDPALPDLRSRL